MTTACVHMDVPVSVGPQVNWLSDSQMYFPIREAMSVWEEPIVKLINCKIFLGLLVWGWGEDRQTRSELA